MSKAAPDLDSLPTFLLVAELAFADGAHPMNALPGLWVRRVDEHWTVAVNGHREPLTYHGGTVPPFNCALDWCGWPAGLLDPGGGVICAGEAANEETFREALVAEIGRVRSKEGICGK